MSTLTRYSGLSLMLVASLALAQPEPIRADDGLYRELGGKDGIRKVVETFLPLVLADARIKENFADFDLEQLNLRLQEQFCELSGGPCRYTGKYRDKTMDGVGTVRDMVSVHQDLKITRAMFNALAEDLQLAMER
ncbi:MAG: group 1 truncated hemoglobin, partial [Burkholderiaceae bacterium]|nr:group 1 truncated hemoglobin [Burkholderiaceae bacterium]